MQIPQDKTLLFDLGGVLLNIDYNKTVNAFKALNESENSIEYSQKIQTNLFDRYEIGEISTPHFLNLLKAEFPENVSIYDLTSAWNAMLGSFITENLDYVLELRKTHQIALLSNTNDLHTSYFSRKLKELTGKKLNDFFDFTFLSHEIGKRKPNPETFLWVAEQLKCSPEQLYFIDDSQQHIDGAIKAGLQANLYPQNSLLNSFFK